MQTCGGPPAIGTVRDQDGLDTFAWSLGVHWQLSGAMRLGFNYSDAPETENLITTDSRNSNLYLQHDLGNRLKLMLYYSRFEREMLDLMLQYRF